MRRITIYAVVLALAGGAVALGIDLLVETDEERIEKVLDEIRSAAATSDADRLVPLLDLDGDGFQIDVGADHDRFAADDVELLQERLSDATDWMRDASLRLESPTIEIDGGRAHAYFRLVLRRDGDPDQSIPVDLALRRVGDDWRATRFRALAGASAHAARR
ncbi:MAG: hypothetical protein HY905_04885 [Deltaproteobacteria bacterium]|nr:hypothetical protein [Deltaproteobacteria bacterium]